MFTKKWLAFFGAGTLAVAASVVTLFPQTVGLGTPLLKLSEEAQKAAQNIPDPCPLHFPCPASGTIMPLDGGVRGICECP